MLFLYPVKDAQIRTVVERLQSLFMAVGRIPKKIYADNAFDTCTFLQFCRDRNIEVGFRPSSLSRSVSVESSHRRIHERMDSFLGEKSPNQWHTVYDKVIMSLNAQPHDAVGFSPYYLFYGKQPDILSANSVPSNVVFDEQ